MATSESDPERYVSASELKAELPFDDDDFPVQTEAEFQNALTRALGSASDLVEQWGATRYEPTEITETVAVPDHVPPRELPLPRRPVQSVSSVSKDGTTLSASSYTIRDTHIVFGEDALHADRYTVSWTYGYEKVPGPVFDAVVRLARNRLDQIETDGYTGDDEGGFRPPEAIKRECAAMVSGYDAPSYYGGATAI